MTNTLPPRDEVMEWKCLASFITYPEYIRSATQNIFTDERAQIYDRMSLVYSQYGQLALDIVKEALEGRLPPELTVVNNVKPTVYINRLAQLARRRQLLETAQVLMAEANQFNPDETKVRESLFFAPIIPSQEIHLEQGGRNLHTDLMRKRSGDYKFASTGLKTFDTMLGGEWPRRSLVIIKARPGTGKTALMCTTMLHLAENNIPTHLWSREMAKEQLMMRWIANKMNIDISDMMNGRSLTDAQLKQIAAMTMQLQELPITVSESTVTMDSIIADTHYLAGKGVRVFGFDYLQIARITKYGNRNQDLGYVAEEFKELAKKYDVTFLVLSQMNDQGEVRDSGEVEQVADVSFGMSNSDDAPDSEGVSVVIVSSDKNRYGPAGKKTSVLFNGKYQRFENMGDSGDDR